MLVGRWVVKMTGQVSYFLKRNNSPVPLFFPCFRFTRDHVLWQIIDFEIRYYSLVFDDKFAIEGERCQAKISPMAKLTYCENCRILSLKLKNVGKQTIC
jgi:hypothetical protein